LNLLRNNSPADYADVADKISVISDICGQNKNTLLNLLRNNSPADYADVAEKISVISDICGQNKIL
jgi:hypothetical protein